MSNNYFSGSNFNDIYKELLEHLVYNPEHITTNRKGQDIGELMNVTLELTNVDNCYAFIRNMSFRYLIGELCFYLYGKNKLKYIKDYSKFWKGISDDGINLNSCYGYYFYNMPLKENKNQMQYVIAQLNTNKESKKAIALIYRADRHSKQSKDNPCTLNMQFYIRDEKLYAVTNMRSNDVWFGLPYDVPYFIFFMKQIYFELKKVYPKLKLGSYIHKACSLHAYFRNIESIMFSICYPYKSFELPSIGKKTIEQLPFLMDYFLNRKNKSKLITDSFIKYGVKIMDNNYFIKKAYAAAKNSTCIKKQVGCVYVSETGKIIAEGYSGRPEPMGYCKECTRKKEVFFQDGCNSVHSEYRGFFNHLKNGGIINQFKNCTIYLTHAPCDQCMKLLLEIKVKKVVFDNYYKSVEHKDFIRYKGLIQVEDSNGKSMF